MINHKMNLRETSKLHEEKLKKIKMALFDVDGVLSTGHIYFQGGDVGFNRFFHTSDGYGLKVLKKAGLRVGIITGGNSLGVKERFELLGLDYIQMGNEDKREGYLRCLEDSGLSDDNVLYMGDEFFDLPLLKRAGFSACPPHSSLEIKEAVDYVSQREAGLGCVREVIDMVRYAQDIVPSVPGF